MAGLGTYWRTLRHLKPVQFYGRARHLLMKAAPDLRPAPPVRRSQNRLWVGPAKRRPSLVGPELFNFLNETHSLSVGWDSPDLEKLWRYNLHYFDDLNAENSETRNQWQTDLLIRWVEENPAGVGTGWESYPLSLRIVNWIKWTLSGNTLPPACLESLAVQVRFLSRRLEHHLLGNHLFSNAKALAFAGMFFDGEEARLWLDKGLQILSQEVPEQILPDGGHFERSPMYHALVLEDMLDLHNLTLQFASAVPAQWHSTIASWPACVERMRSWLECMCHPDGEISFFNDAAFGIAPTPSELNLYAARLGLSVPPLKSVTDVRHLSSSGYVRIQSEGAVVLLDVAPIGPDHLPGHGHADTLSFEISIFGQRVLVNSGTSCYGRSPERLRQRGTAAHNTVTVEGENSSEVWSGFRVGRRARPQNLLIKREPEIDVACSHDGYRWMPGHPEHVRRWILKDHELTIEDQIKGRFRFARAHFYLHPLVTFREDTSTLILPFGHELEFRVENGAIHKEHTVWHPEFGASVPNWCVTVEFQGPMLRTSLKWTS